MKHGVDILICGAGIAGVSAAYFLSSYIPGSRIMIADEKPPLSLTSDHSTECYRNWWPGPDNCMVTFMNRSISLLEHLADISGNTFQLNRRGYLYLTADPAKRTTFRKNAEAISALGAGPLRIHTSEQISADYKPAPLTGYLGQPDGADLLLDPDLIHHHFPYLSESICAALHVRKAGWLSAQQLGMYLLNCSRSNGVQFVRDRVIGTQISKNQITLVKFASGETLPVGIFVNAAGPFLKQVSSLSGIQLPVFSELHQKVAFNDSHRIVARDAPLLIWTDAQKLDWSDEEREFLQESPQMKWLLETMPPGVHTRPEGGVDSSTTLMLWEYHTNQMEPEWPLPVDPLYPEIVHRGLIPMLPGLRAYLGKFPKPQIDGGYYIKTIENRPIIGPLPISGAYILGALSGFGIMASCAAGELLAFHIAGASLPDYAPAFSLDRYDNPDYRKRINNWKDSGQL